MIDPIGLELIQERMISIVREMRTIIIRTAYSPMIHEGHDFSCAVLSPAGEFVSASAVDQPAHLSALPWSARTVLRKYGHDLAPGDLHLHNDPYTGGTHLNDVALIHPLFVGTEPIALVAVMAHWQDMGGMVPGSLAGSAVDVFQEGIRIPALRIARRGKPLREVLDLLFANVRGPDERRGDLHAMQGACRVAEGNLRGVLARWGPETFRSAMTLLLDRAETRMRQAIGRVPDGDYAYESYLDHSGTSPEPILLKVCLSIRGDSIRADFTGCPPQVAGPTNVGPAHAGTAVYTMVKALLDPRGPINGGAFRPISVVVPEGTVVSARPPAACGAIGEVRRGLESLVMGSLVRALPDRTIGDLKGAANITSIGGLDARRDATFVFTEFPAGGTGAFAGSDGDNTVRNFAEGDLSSIHPVEAIEHAYPIRVRRSVLREDSGGDGTCRGGLGLRREIELLAPEGSLSVLSDKNVIPPYGVRKGPSGAPNRFVVIRDGLEVQPSTLPGKVTGFRLRQGDLVVMETAGGGGYGDPLDRDPAKALRDVAFGYVSREKAREVYGVVLDGSTVDAPATAALREHLRAQRWRLLAVLLEVAHPTGPSLRFWVRLDGRFPHGVCALGPSGLAIVGAAPGDRLELRRPVQGRA